MKAVVYGITEEQLAERRARGLDRFDEMWEGVLHMAPAPANEHQNLVTDLSGVLRGYAKRHGLGKVLVQCNVRDPERGENDYRIPDIAFVRSSRLPIIGKVYIEGAPDVVIEVLSPDDETYEKMPFYERIGCPWLVVVASDGTKLEVFRLTGARYVQQAPGEGGWIRCEPLEVAWRSTGERDGLFVRLERDGREERIGD